MLNFGSGSGDDGVGDAAAAAIKSTADHHIKNKGFILQ